MSFGLFKNVTYKLFAYKSYDIYIYIYIYIYKQDLALNNPQELIFHKIQPSQTKSCPVTCGCRVHRLHLCRGVRHPPTNE